MLPSMRFVCLLLTLGFALAAQADVAVGDPAPAFALSGSDGKVHSLTDSVGKRAVVVAWFPKAFTPG
jgi:peroxiredoxin Q/BCP